MPKGADKLSDRNNGGDVALESRDADMPSPQSRKLRRRPKSERIIEDISVERRVALEILADR